MIRSYLIISWRNLLRNKIFSFINITGLAIGLAVGFLIFQYIEVERSYDRFHVNADRIYRVPIAYSGSFSSLRPSAINHPAVGPALKADFPEVEAYTRLVRASLFIPAATVTYEKSAGQAVTFNEERVYLVDQSFFTVFTFPLVNGDAATALKEPLSVVITETMAKKYFGDDVVLGKILQINRANFKVTGVMKDIPQHSHLQFDILVSLSTVGSNFFDAWTWPEFYNYVLLVPGTDVKALEKKLPAFTEKYLGKIWEEYKFRSEISLQPLTDIHLKSNLGFEQSVNGSERTVYFLTILAIFVLVIAWINYVNLSTAKSLERSKEVGLRKASGASKQQLITQFFFDAFFINLIAVVFAAIILVISLPYFETLTGKDISGILSATGAWTSPSFWGLVVATLLLGILVVGLYPAILLSSFNPALVLKGKFYKSTSGITLRKGLVVFQYALSIFLIAGTITISRQLKFMQEKDLGYTKEQLLVVRSAAIFDSTYATQIRYFENELLRLPGVARMANSNEVPGRTIEDRNSIRRAHLEEKDKVGSFMVAVDNEFFDTYHMQLAAGRNFNENDRFMPRRNDEAPNPNAPRNRVMINEDLAAKLGFGKPEDAINQILKMRLGPEYDVEIIGVVKNHHHVSLKENFQPIAYYYPVYDFWRYFSIRLNTTDYRQTVDGVRKIYAQAFPHNAFEYFFLDDHFNNQYQSDAQFENIFGVFTMLAIVIACLGLLGLGVFAVSQRTKEIGIRKVLGASVVRILYLFTRDSIQLVLISYIIAAPAIYFAVGEWLDTFAFHTGLEWQVFLVPPVLLLTISVATIVFISLRAAFINPATALRHE